MPAGEALAQLGRVLGLDVVRGPDSALLRPRERNRLRAVGVPARAWCQLLASLAGQDVLVAPGVNGAVTVDLADVDYGAALRSTMAALGHRVDQEQGLLRVSPQGHVASLLEQQSSASMRVTLADGSTVDLPGFHAAAVTPQRRLAILGGRFYLPGDALIDARGDELFDVRVLGIFEQSVIVDVRSQLVELSAEPNHGGGRPALKAAELTLQDLLRRVGDLLQQGLEDAATLELVAALCERVRVGAQDEPKLQRVADGLHATAVLRRCGAKAALSGGDGVRAAELATAAAAEAEVPAGVRELLVRFEGRARRIARAVEVSRERRETGDTAGARAGYAELLEQKDVEGAYRDEAQRALEELGAADPPGAEPPPAAPQ